MQNQLIVYMLLIGASFMLAPSAPADAVIDQYQFANGQLAKSIERKTWVNADGLKISWVRFKDGPNALGKPILIVPGRGESAFRYVELAHSLGERGLGPVYLMEHQSQGFSDHNAGVAIGATDVKDFDDYVRDLLAFIEGPLKQDLRARHLGEDFSIIAHSMGGAITNLALQKHPGLVQHVAYFAPMFDIKTPGAMNLWRDRPAEWVMSLVCLAGCATRSLPVAQAKAKPVVSLDLARRAWPGTMETEVQIRSSGVTPRWVREAIRATRRITPPDAPEVKTLIYTAAGDRMVDNQTTYQYACQASHCTLIETSGGHEIHLSPSAIYDGFINQLAGFLSDGRATPLFPCEKLLVSGHDNINAAKLLAN